MQAVPNNLRLGKRLNAHSLKEVNLSDGLLLPKALATKTAILPFESWHAESPWSYQLLELDVLQSGFQVNAHLLWQQ